MKHLKLVVNNENKKKDIFFNKKELKLILNLYAEMVSGGEWKDYGLSISKKNFQQRFFSEIFSEKQNYCKEQVNNSWLHIKKYFIVKIQSKSSKESN